MIDSSRSRPTVAAGSYFIQTRVNLADTGATAADYGCDLVDTGGEFQFAPAETPSGSQDATQLTFNEDPDSVAADWELDALQVGTVH